MAGVGFGILASAQLAGLAWPAFAIGLGLHLFGMVGVRRALLSGGYEPARWEQAAYWLCWLIILALLLLFAWQMLF